MIHKMMSLVRTSPRLILLATVVVLITVGGACKSKKKAMEVSDISAADKERMEREAALKKQREEEEARRKEADEKARKEAEARNSDPYIRLEKYFTAIGGASSVASANSSISEALTLFTSGETPVLIVISEAGGQKDYDRPTTIKDYLNYLKDQKKRADKIGTLQFDGSGKITEVELIKQK